MSVRRLSRMPTGYGVWERHSRRCATTRGAACTCEPSYLAWVYDAARRAKRTHTFPTLLEARAWRVERLRRMYETPVKHGRADRAYVHLRKALQELDAATGDLDERGRVAARAAMVSLYEAEDRFLSVLGGQR